MSVPEPPVAHDSQLNQATRQESGTVAAEVEELRSRLVESADKIQALKRELDAARTSAQSAAPKVVTMLLAAAVRGSADQIPTLEIDAEADAVELQVDLSGGPAVEVVRVRLLDATHFPVWGNPRVEPEGDPGMQGLRVRVPVGVFIAEGGYTLVIEAAEADGSWSELRPVRVPRRPALASGLESSIGPYRGELLRLLRTVSFFVSALLCLAAIARGSTPPVDPGPFHVGPDSKLEVPFATGSGPVFVEVDLGGHDLAFAQVIQKGVDVAVNTPGDACQPERWTIDLRRGTSGTESVPLAARADGGTAQIVIEPLSDSPTDARVVVQVAGGEFLDRAAEHCLAWRAFLDARSHAARGPAGQAEAIADYRRSVEIFRRLGDEQHLSQVLFNQAVSEHWLGRIDDALDHLSEVRRRLAGREESRVVLFDALSETAIIFQRQGRDDVAAALFGDALALAEDLGDPLRISKALSGIGLVLKRLDRWPEALDHYLRALDLAVGKPCREAAARINLGRIYDKLGEYQSALEHSVRAAELARDLEKDGRSTCRVLSAARNSLGIVYLNLGRWDAAADAFESALQDADAAGKPRILVNLGRTLVRGGEPERARHAYLEAADLGAELGDETSQYSAWSNLGHLVLTESQQNDLARNYYERAARFVGSPDGHEAAHLLVLRAELDLASGDADAAAKKAAHAIDLARRLESSSQLGIALYFLAKSRLRQGRIEEATRLAAEATRTVEGLRQSAAGHDFRASFLSGRAGYFELWIRALLERHRLDSDPRWLEKSLEVAERSRARTLLDMLDSAEIERSELVDPELARLERELESLHIRRLNLGENAGDDRRVQLARSLAAVQARILERRSHLRASHPRWSELRSAETLGVNEIRRHTVDDETVLLHSFVGEESAWLWLVRGDEIRSVAIPPRAQLEERVRRLLAALSAPAETLPGEDLDGRRRRLAAARRAFEETGARLSDDLFRTLLDGTDASRIVVVPDGPLAYLPFAALPDPRSASRQPFVYAVEWVQLPSASVLASLRRKNSAPTQVGVRDRTSLAVLADPVFSSEDSRLHGDSPAARARNVPDEREFRRLPETAVEARQLASLVTGDSLVATGFDATAQLVKSGALEPYRLVHFATHGVIDTQWPELSALVFSRVGPDGEPLDGFLRLPDVYRLRLTADVVVLSACETALGQEIRGEGLIGLTRGFLYAGASSVLASLWAVEDQATRELMELAYRSHLESGLPMAAAVHEAQRTMAARGFGPYYWAGFVLQGDWN